MIKSNLLKIDNKLGKQIIDVESKLLVKIAKTQGDMLKWVVGVAVASVGPTTSLIGLLQVSCDCS